MMANPFNPELVLTSDGSHTLFVPGMNEHYHSHFGAITESRHIFINAGLAMLDTDSASILEAGFGTGLNALLTALYAEEHHISIRYTAIEKYPLETSLVRRLNYGSLTGNRGTLILEELHTAPWGIPVPISEWLTLVKLQADLTKEGPEGLFDLVYFDAFGPDKQPEMWSEEVFRRIATVTHTGSVFVTYSAKGDLKRMLKAMGFDVAHLPGPPGKRVITRAVKR